jgi:hypothetical protein
LFVVAPIGDIVHAGRGEQVERIVRLGERRTELAARFPAAERAIVSITLAMTFRSASSGMPVISEELFSPCAIHSHPSRLPASMIAG